jgi:hypothetical protein
MPAPHRDGPLPGWLAVALVVGTSAAVLVLEILAGRLLAPYVGVSLETYTGIIGTVLAGIAVGAWVGGFGADRVDPRRLVPVLLVGGGSLAIATIPIVRWLGRMDDPDVTLLTAAGFLPAATVLSAVPPAVVKLQLRDLAATGSTVGRLSAYGTAGAIVGTFLTGFVLVRWAAVSTLVVVVGATLVLAGLALALAGGARRRHGRDVAAVALVGVVATGALARSHAPCETQTRYYCASVRVDPARPSARTLVLDDLRHSYVDLADPTHLEFWYVRRLVDGIDAMAPPGALDVVHVGGGGLTLPRYVRAVRPGSRQTVLEIDADLVRLVERELAFAPGDDVAVEVGDARLALRRVHAGSTDVVVGDAFGSRAVPFHLATREFLADVHRVLRPGGVYVANVIDSGRRAFLRAEAATLASVFAHVAVVLGPGAVAGLRSNSVLVASDRPIADVLRRAPVQGGELVDDVDAFVRGASLLTDDFAPVDQLLSRG